MTGNGFPIKIDNVAGSAIVEFGGALFISPKSASKSYHGSGSSNTAAQVNTFTLFSSTNTIQSDLIDQPIVRDN
ncbi:spore germination protein [Neobacillus terrae]|uniref:spore germination protein n=1 Tax=Neobacillus terrae TaxID=3034837 RepID=UPI00140842BC|nr:spore germination protein [Neobacillus terrae]NHM33940.1 spore germination protein [Neobacillus terrae]